MKLKKMIVLAGVVTTLFASIPNLEGKGIAGVKKVDNRLTLKK